MDKNSLSHTSWNCKYHIVFAPKYRRQVIYVRLKQDIGKILRDLWEKRNKHNRSRMLSRQYLHVAGNPTKIYHISHNGIFKREK